MTDFGGKLRQARERRGISLRQIAASTKISVAALEALERNDISRLPGGIFSRAFVRSYALEVGLDPDETVREFLERFHEEPPPAAAHAAVAVPEQESQFENQQRMASVLLKLVLVSVPLIIIILYFTLRSRPTPQPPSEAPEQAATPEPAPPPERAVPAPSAPRPSSGAVPPATGGASTPVPKGLTGTKGASPASTPASKAVPARQPLKLELHPTGPCWISLTVDGERLFARVMQPGERESRTVQREAVIEIGDAGAFDFSIDGRPGRSLGAPGQVKTARITQATAASYLK
jgi:cytoskeleton protein RodZ